MKQPGQSYTTIETAYGFLFFTHTTEGDKKLRNFMQRMADHYFDPPFNLGPVRVYRAEGNIPYPLSANSDAPFLRGYPYCQIRKTPEMILEYQNEMKPTPEDYNSFCHHTRCSKSCRNSNIADTLGAIESKEHELSELAKQGMRPDIQSQIEDANQDKALLEKLLKQYYDVRGHRSVENILDDPAYSVTVDGIRLFAPHRQVLKAGHVLFLPGEVKNNPSHSYAWVNEDFSRIVFSKEPPGTKQVFQVKTTIEKALNKKRDAKKKNSIHPKR